MDKVKEYKVTVRQFLTKPSTDPRYKDKPPVPMRTMFGYVTKETANGIYMKLRAKPAPASHCLRCGREITNPVSLLYGYGIECITRIPFAVPLVDPNNLEEYMKDLQEKMADITWEGWLPKFHIEMEETGNMIEPFLEPAEENKPEAQIERKPIVMEKKAEEAPVDEKLVEELCNELMSL